MDNLKEYIKLKIKRFANRPMDKNKDFFEGQLIAYHDILDKISEHAPKPDNLVRIKSCYDFGWYSDCIGKTFSIIDYDGYDFEVFAGEYIGSMIRREDCEIVNN